MTPPPQTPVGEGEVTLTVIFILVNVWLVANIVGGISAIASIEDTDMAQHRTTIRRFEQVRDRGVVRSAG